MQYYIYSKKYFVSMHIQLIMSSNRSRASRYASSTCVIAKCLRFDDFILLTRFSFALLCVTSRCVIVFHLIFRTPVVFVLLPYLFSIGVCIDKIKFSAGLETMGKDKCSMLIARTLSSEFA